MSNPLALPEQGGPVNWPEPDNNYINTCRACERTFFGPKRAPCCHECFLIGMERRKEGEAAYDAEHPDQQYGFSETSLVVYREGWISGWTTAKHGATEVELISNDYDCLLKCSGCGGFTPYHFLEEFKECNYCPSCGGKIKKP